MHSAAFLLALLSMMVLHPAQADLYNSSTSRKALSNLPGAVLQHIAQAPPLQHRKPNGSSDRQLQDHITLLPTPVAPQKWMQMLQEVEAKGAAALTDWVHADTCILPDIQGSKGDWAGWV